MNGKPSLSILDVSSGDISYFDILDKSSLENIYFGKDEYLGELNIKDDGITLKYLQLV